MARMNMEYLKLQEEGYKLGVWGIPGESMERYQERLNRRKAIETSEQHDARLNKRIQTEDSINAEAKVYG